MKRRNFWLGTAALLGLASTANAQITNSAHDFSGSGWADGEICKPCHTPHFADITMPRLWNHTLTTATYTLHDGSTGTATADFDVASRMCMSCHDGTVALDSFGGRNGSLYIPNRSKIGVDLRDDHPVGSEAQYPPLNPPTWWSEAFRPATKGSVANGADRLSLKSWVNPSGGTQFVVGCTTCHNAHNRGNFPHMTAITNASSRVCLTCHIK